MYVYRVNPSPYITRKGPKASTIEANVNSKGEAINPFGVRVRFDLL